MSPSNCEHLSVTSLDTQPAYYSCMDCKQQVIRHSTLGWVAVSGFDALDRVAPAGSFEDIVAQVMHSTRNSVAMVREISDNLLKTLDAHGFQVYECVNGNLQQIKAPNRAVEAGFDLLNGGMDKLVSIGKTRGIDAAKTVIEQFWPSVPAVEREKLLSEVKQKIRLSTPELDDGLDITEG